MLAGATGCDEGSITGHLLDAAPREDAAAREDDAGADDDAAPGDPDAGPPTGLLTVHVTLAGVPLEGTPVVFHTAGGALIDSQQTDAAGEAVGHVSAGGQVTTFLPMATATLFTVTGVSPGETVTIDPLGWASGDAGTIAVRAAAGAAGTTTYYGETCTDEHVLPAIKTPTTIPLPAGCLDGGGTFDLLVRATGADGATIAYRQALDVTPDADMATDVTLAAPWRKDVDPATVSLTAAPAFATLAAASALAVRSDRPFNLGAQNAAVVEGGAADLAVPVPGLFAERVALTAALAGDATASTVTRDLAPPGALAVTGADFLEPPLAVEIDDAGGDLVVTWDNQADGADLQTARIAYDADGARAWVVVLAPGVYSAVLPPLPAPLTAVAPELDEISAVTVGAIETSLLEGYDQARTARPGIVFRAFAAFVPGETDYTLRLAYRIAQP